MLRKPRNEHKCRRFDRCKTMRQTEAKLLSEETRMRTRERRRRRRRRIRGSFFSDVILLFRPCFSNILFLYLLLLSSSSSSVLSSETEHLSLRNQTLRPLEELNKLKAIKQHLRKINKPSVKTIYVSEIYKKNTLLTPFLVFMLCFRNTLTRFFLFLLCFLSHGPIVVAEF